MSSKIRLAARGLGYPFAFHLSAGWKGDARKASALLKARQAGVVMADTAYDAKHLRSRIAQTGAVAVVPINLTNRQKLPFDKGSYNKRHLVECCFSKLTAA